MSADEGGGVMATCKDCVHAEVCKEYVVGLAAVRGVALNMDDLEAVLQCDDCANFKDRSRFVELPVKPGEKVFYFDTTGRIYESTVTQLIYDATGFLIDSDVMFDSNLIGERFFLTRKEAEQALREREENA